MDAKSTIVLEGENEGLKQALAESNSMLSSFAGAATGAFTGMFAAFAVDKVIGWGKAFIKDAEEGIAVSRTLEGALEGTGHAAGWTKDQIGEMANELMVMGNHAITSGEEAATAFVKMKTIRGDVFKDAMHASGDLAAFLGTELPSAANLLARSLADPERGFMRLKAAGVVLSDSQKENIKDFVEMGETSKAQRILLDELNKVVGGRMAKNMDDLSFRFQALKTWAGETGEAIGNQLVAAGNALVPILDAATGRAKALWGAFNVLIEPIYSVADAAGTILIASFQLASEAADWLVDRIVEAAEYVRSYWTPAFEEGGSMIQQWASYIWDTLKPAIDWMADTATSIFAGIKTAIENFGDTIHIVFLSAKISIMQFWGGLIHSLTEVIPAYLNWFAENWLNIFTDMATATIAVFDNLAKNIGSFFEALKGLWRGDGFDWKLTPLLEGFEATTAALPEIAERIKGAGEQAAEKELQDLMDKQYERYSKAKTQVEDRIKEVYKETQEAVADVEEETKKLADGPGKWEEAQLDDSGGAKAATEDLLALNKRITEAASGKTPEEKTVDAIADGANAQVEATAAAASQTSKQLAGIKTAIDNMSVGGLA